MDLPIYDSVRQLISTPNTFYLEQMQAMVNDQWDNTTQTPFTVLMQQGIGSNEYVKTDISIDMAIDIGTGYKKGDDFKVFSHRNISTDTATGLMYQYANNYWITINTNKLASPTSDVEVRRCNNALRWINPMNGALNVVPCAIDYELSSPQPLKDKDVVVANGHCFVIVQGSELVRSIEYNQRFIFNGRPFKVTGIQSLLNDDIDTTEATLLYIDLFLDTEQPTDDLINDIANRFEYKYTINIEPTITEQLSGFNGSMIATVTLNDEVVDRDVAWSGNEFVKIDENGNYTLTGEVGDVAQITATLSGSPSIYDTFNITIVDTILDNFDIVIEPQFNEVRIKVPITFSANLYNNGIKESDNVTVGASGLLESYYSLSQVGNTFTLEALKISTEPLVLTFSSQIATKTIEVMLLPFF